MQPQTWINDYAALPKSAQREVADFVAFLRQKYAANLPQTKPVLKDVTKEPFIGMWRDRTDLMDSTQWVRDVRKKEWELWHDSH